MRFVALTAPNKDTVYVAPEQVMMVRPPLGSDPLGARAILVLVGGVYAVHENVEEVVDLLEAAK
jgi:hypothetical protein